MLTLWPGNAYLSDLLRHKQGRINSLGHWLACFYSNEKRSKPLCCHTVVTDYYARLILYTFTDIPRYLQFFRNKNANNLPH